MVQSVPRRGLTMERFLIIALSPSQSREARAKDDVLLCNAQKNRRLLWPRQSIAVFHEGIEAKPRSFGKEKLTSKL
ncbi:hypothetical protein HUJ04_012754 [Dendroctonus ponderosae]|nr:hypothetical protein HUJ04_012754 [Dendroctonus ponderosae]